MYISDAIAFACAQSHISAKRIRHLHWCISATSIKHINKPFGIVVWSTLAPRPKQSVPTPTRVPHAPSAQIIDDSESFCVFVVRRRWHTKHTKWSHPYIYIWIISSNQFGWLRNWKSVLAKIPSFLAAFVCVCNSRVPLGHAVERWSPSLCHRWNIASRRLNNHHCHALWVWGDVCIRSGYRHETTSLCPAKNPF